MHFSEKPLQSALRAHLSSKLPTILAGQLAIEAERHIESALLGFISLGDPTKQTPLKSIFSDIFAAYMNLMKMKLILSEISDVPNQIMDSIIEEIRERLNIFSNFPINKETEKQFHLDLEEYDLLRNKYRIEAEKVLADVVKEEHAKE